MEHRSFVLKIDPKDAADYLKRHEKVYAELEEQFGKVGIHSYHIFYHEGTLFAYMLVEDYEKAMSQLAHHPANLRWQEFMSDMLIPWESGETSKDIPKMYSYEKEGLSRM